MNYVNCIRKANRDVLIENRLPGKSLLANIFNILPVSMDFRDLQFSRKQLFTNSPQILGAGGEPSSWLPPERLVE